MFCFSTRRGLPLPSPHALCFLVTSSSHSFCHSSIPLCIWHLCFLFYFILLLSPLCQDRQDRIEVVVSMCLWLNKMSQSWRNCRNIFQKKPLLCTTTETNLHSIVLLAVTFKCNSLYVFFQMILEIVFYIFLYFKEMFITCSLCKCGVKKAKI